VGGFGFMLGPAIGALVAVRSLPRADRRAALGLSFRFDVWLLAAWLVPAILVAAATVGSALVPGTHLLSPAVALRAQLEASAGPAQAAKLDAIPPGVLSCMIVLQAVITGPLLNAPIMLSEELGWRGLLWSRWRGLGFRQQALATGVSWGLWHAPLIAMGRNYPDNPISGIFLMVLFCVVLTPVMHLIRERGTIAHACLFHGTINAGATLGKVCIVSTSWMGLGIVGVPGILLLALASAYALRLMRNDGIPSGS